MPPVIADAAAARARVLTCAHTELTYTHVYARVRSIAVRCAHYCGRASPCHGHTRARDMVPGIVNFWQVQASTVLFLVDYGLRGAPPPRGHALFIH